MTDLKGLRVLVVEDTFLVADMIADQLQECGCDVVGPVSRVGPAAALAAQETLSGALLDVNLAGEESFPVARILRERGIPFAFLTGYGGEMLPPEHRGDACLVKPFNLDELVQLVASHFRPERHEGSAA